MPSSSSVKAKLSLVKLLLEMKLSFSSDFYTFPAGVVGWVLKMKLMLTQLSTKWELKLKLKLSLAIVGGPSCIMQ